MSASFDSTAKVWSTRDWSLQRTLSGHEGKVRGRCRCGGGGFDFCFFRFFAAGMGLTSAWFFDILPGKVQPQMYLDKIDE